MCTIYQSTKMAVSIVLTAASFSISVLLHAQTTTPAEVETQGAEDEAGPELILKVKPSLCLRYSSEEDCKLSVEIVWRDSSPNTYCLHSIQDQEPVRCWDKIAGAAVEEDREINEDLVYWLARPGESSKLVTATVEMATIVEDEKRNRSRRRHVWNLI